MLNNSLYSILFVDDDILSYLFMFIFHFFRFIHLIFFCVFFFRLNMNRIWVHSPSFAGFIWMCTTFWIRSSTPSHQINHLFSPNRLFSITLDRTHLHTFTLKHWSKLMHEWYRQQSNGRSFERSFGRSIIVRRKWAIDSSKVGLIGATNIGVRLLRFRIQTWQHWPATVVTVGRHAFFVFFVQSSNYHFDRRARIQRNISIERFCCTCSSFGKQFVASSAVHKKSISSFSSPSIAYTCPFSFPTHLHCTPNIDASYLAHSIWPLPSFLPSFFPLSQFLVWPNFAIFSLTIFWLPDNFKPANLTNRPSLSCLFHLSITLGRLVCSLNFN